MKKLVFIIAGIDIVLLAVCMFLYLGKDRTAPVISFGENAVSYEEGMDERLLLQGVVAMDEKDGDVSDSLLVEKIAGTNGKEVIVTYVARDSANNVEMCCLLRGKDWTMNMGWMRAGWRSRRQRRRVMRRVVLCRMMWTGMMQRRNGMGEMEKRGGRMNRMRNLRNVKSRRLGRIRCW